MNQQTEINQGSDRQLQAIKTLIEASRAEDEEKINELGRLAGR